MSKHTPGPWVAYADKPELNVGYVTVESESGDHIFNKKIYRTNAEEQLANANLIAAAPDLLAALRDALTSMLDSGYSNDRVIIRKVRSAINKAEGKA